VTATTGSELHLVDSSGWVEFFGDGPKAAAFGEYLTDEEHLLLPSIVVYEVYKKLRREGTKVQADRFASQALRFLTTPLTADLPLQAAGISLEHSLAMADAIIYATARAQEAQLITSDRHFEGLLGVTLL
jgi:predicted nucleic acid-binding protein